MPEHCSDSFLITILGELLCTFKLKDRGAVAAVFGNNTFEKVLLFTPGTGVDQTHANFGFRAEYDPTQDSADFPEGVLITGGFVELPDLSGNLTEVREVTFKGVIAVDVETYTGGSQQFKVELIFNPGIDN